MRQAESVTRIARSLSLDPQDKSAWEALEKALQARGGEDFSWLQHCPSSPFVSQAFIRMNRDREGLRFCIEKQGDYGPEELRLRLWASSTPPLHLRHPILLRMGWSWRRGLLWGLDCLERNATMFRQVLAALEQRRMPWGGFDLTPEREAQDLFLSTLKSLRTLSTCRNTNQIQTTLNDLEARINNHIDDVRRGAETPGSAWAGMSLAYYERPNRQTRVIKQTQFLLLMKALQRLVQKRVGDCMGNIVDAMPDEETRDYERRFQTDRLLDYLGYSNPPHRRTPNNPDTQ